MSKYIPLVFLISFLCVTNATEKPLSSFEECLSRAKTSYFSAFDRLTLENDQLRQNIAALSGNLNSSRIPVTSNPFPKLVSLPQPKELQGTGLDQIDLIIDRLQNQTSSIILSLQQENVALSQQLEQLKEQARQTEARRKAEEQLQREKADQKFEECLSRAETSYFSAFYDLTLKNDQLRQNIAAFSGSLNSYRIPVTSNPFPKLDSLPQPKELQEASLDQIIHIIDRLQKQTSTIILSLHQENEALSQQLDQLEKADEQHALMLHNQLNGDSRTKSNDELDIEWKDQELALRVQSGYDAGPSFESKVERYLKKADEQYVLQLNYDTSLVSGNRLGQGAHRFVMHVLNTKYDLIRSEAPIPLLEQFTDILLHVDSFTRIAGEDEKDVHVMDTLVFGKHKQIEVLCKIGTLFHIDNPNLSLTGVELQLTQFVKKNPFYFEHFLYKNPNFRYKDTSVPENITIPADEIERIIKSHFSNMENEVNRFFSYNIGNPFYIADTIERATMCDMVREVWSRAWTLTQTLFAENEDYQYICIFMEQVLDGHKTRGGCIQGRMDRGFLSYALALSQAEAGLQ